MKRIILDTDTAGDDTIAIMMALRAKDARLEGITINCGNINFDQEVENALYTVELSGESGKVPVYPGARHPLLKEWRTVEDIHGADGMGDSRFPRARQRPERKHAVDAIIDSINESPGEITLVEIAPMTNVALALRKDPGIAKKVKEFYFMGGSNQYLGNVTPAAEFNIWVDPDAASIVLNSGMPVTMVGWEIVMRHGLIGVPELQEIGGMKTKESEFYLAVNRQVRKYMEIERGVDGTSCPDSITMAIVLNPKVATETRDRFVEVDAADGVSRGVTWVDELGYLKRKPNVRVVYEASQRVFRDMLYTMLRGGRV
ncbi:MAG: nucleoside hydrolase [Nitrososphaerota archaeon]|nr:nucleoside hydrolase [Nitrososphaerota archaeon]MDG6965047.1 nucleoside hydrolase [Nitrososphaerota archaeon]MDG6968095.1 nucleoside hydrolase [Nitrososphaerota archaeon]MDG6968979.1 nucleoside hydrolase [Nitrososphaerota archaeon]MDG6973612.1 nucleoside hydrolase [Nitrososphaerota archaeon]